MSAEGRATIDYGPRPASATRRRLRRWLAPAVVLVAVAASSPYWGPRVWLRARVHYWQRQCLQYAPPAGRLVYSDDPADVAGAGGRTGYASDGKSVSYVPEAWDQFYRLISPPGLRSRGTLFLGRLKTPSGEVRLVAVDLVEVADASGFSSWDGPPFATYDEFRRPKFSVRVFRPGGWLRTPLELPSRIDYPLGVEYSPPVACHAGAADPRDPTHFTVSYGHAGAPDLMDGWIHDDNSVVLEPREQSPSAAAVAASAPATPSAPPSPGRSP